MMGLVNYTDSDTETEKEEGSEIESGENNLEKEERRKIPIDVLNKFSKAPLKLHLNKDKKENWNKRKMETSFAYIPIKPNKKLIIEVERIINVIISNGNENNVINNIKNLCINELTKDIETLHISLSYNITKSKDEMDDMITGIENELEHAIKFPMNIQFEKEFRYLYNQDGSKCFIALVVSRDDGNHLEKLVSFFNQHSSMEHSYDAGLLHVSVAVMEGCSVSSSNTLPSQLSLPEPPTLRARCVEVTRGRSVCQLGLRS